VAERARIVAACAEADEPRPGRHKSELVLSEAGRQPEVGFGAVPGGTPMGQLAELVGQGRAMEIAVGGDDFPAQLAAEYGYVNRVLPEDELDDFVDTFARRVAGFSKAGVSGTKEFVDGATAIPAGDYAAALAAFKRTAGRPENTDHVRSLFERGLQPDGIELDLGKHVAEKL
jgi:enoyl-CoA hydratase/carnithine racemase